MHRTRVLRGENHCCASTHYGQAVLRSQARRCVGARLAVSYLSDARVVPRANERVHGYTMVDSMSRSSGWTDFVTNEGETSRGVARERGWRQVCKFNIDHLAKSIITHGYHTIDSYTPSCPLPHRPCPCIHSKRRALYMHS